ncbi:DnaT-like ssDNA-binding domain-containing protein [Pantoea brenneri]
MHPEWQPSSDLIQIAAVAGITLNKLPEPAQIAGFRAFWRSSSDRHSKA